MEKPDWDKVNAELKIKIAPLEFEISRANVTNAALLGDQLNLLIITFVEARPEIFEKSEVKANPSATFVKHQSKNAIITTILYKENLKT